MTDFEIQYVLESMVVLVDTREQPTIRAKKRYKDFGLPYMRKKLDFGDYSACVTIDDELYSFADEVAIERKMSLDELCSCYCNGRKRFEREFERAKVKNAKIYLLIENGSWESVYLGQYRSMMSPNALKSSILAWLSRYNCQLIFCKPETTGKLIADILQREIKERLVNMADE